jgi:hypothetical protein
MSDLCACCCGCCTCMIFITAFYFICISFKGYFWPMFYWGFYISLYGLGIVLYGVLFFWLIYWTNEAGFDIIRRKERNKLIYKENELQSSIRFIFGIIALHLLFLTITILASMYFQVWYVKLPLVIYICFVLGYVASFPLDDDMTKLIVDGGYSYRVNNEIALKTFLNSLAFAGMYATYYFYFAK